jgi:hypothetical protein
MTPLSTDRCKAVSPARSRMAQTQSSFPVATLTTKTSATTSSTQVTVAVMLAQPDKPEIKRLMLLEMPD